LRRSGERALAWLAAHPVAVLGFSVAGMYLSISGMPNLLRREPAGGFYPFNLSFLELFAYLPMLALPVAVSIATAFGFVRAVREFHRLGGLALSLFILVRAYFAAENQYFEMGRYFSYIAPAVFLLAIFGNAHLYEIVRRWTPNRRRALQVAYLVAWFTWPMPGIGEFYARPDSEHPGGIAQWLLAFNTQREVRYLLSLTEGHPECVYIGRVILDYRDSPMIAPEYAYVVFGRPIVGPVVIPEKQARLDDVASRFASGASCVRLYSGGDCNLGVADGCREFTTGRRLVDEKRFWSRPYNLVQQSGFGTPEITLATYAWP
jgi:hypothetical protein